MKSDHNSPKTLLQAIQHYSDNRTCVEHVKNLRWADGVVRCPRCDSNHVKELSTRQIWKCYGCKKQFSVKVGTIFEDSPLPLTKWLVGMWLVINAKNGISSYELHRSLGVTQKTAWFMSHRLREIMRTGSIEKLTGTAEVDETYIGGSRTNWSNSKRARTPRNFDHKTPVFAAMERGGRVTANLLTNTSEKSIREHVRRSVHSTATLYSDNAQAYQGLEKEYRHFTVNHKQSEYVRGDVHTNTVEGFFGLFKRCIKGTHIHLSAFHIDRYLSEECLRYNLRKSDDGARFQHVSGQVFGRRLTYKQLTRKITTQ